MTFNPVPKVKYKRRKPTRKQRGAFSKKTRDKLFEDYNGLCGVCHTTATQIHHVMPKGSGKGRGVYTNGLPICNDCHDEIHRSGSKLKHWQRQFEIMFGTDYYKDEYDKG